MLSTRSISVFLFFLSSASSATLRAAGGEQEELTSLFHAWSDTHGKEYASKEEHVKRLEVWLANHGK
jgi:hypothetical protein